MKKICSRCKVEVSLDGFSKDRSRSDGYSNWCKVCKSSYNKERYNKNPEKYRVWQRNYQEKNREQCNKASMKYYYKNKDKINKQRRITSILEPTEDEIMAIVNKG